MIIYGIVLFFGVDWRLALVIILSSIISIVVPRAMGEKLADIRGVYQKQIAKYVSVTTMQSMHDVCEKVLSYLQKEQSQKILIQNFEKEISVSGVGFQKGDFEIRDLNLRIEKGKKYAITGPSGSGKSTLLKMLSKIEIPETGMIRIDGNDIKERDISSVIADAGSKY